MLNDFHGGMYVARLAVHSMEIDKVAFGTQGHTQKESYRKWHLAIVMSLPIILEQETIKSKTSSENMFIGIDILQ